MSNPAKHMPTPPLVRAPRQDGHRARSSELTKRARRAENWGPAGVVPSTPRRHYFGVEHLPPADRYGRRDRSWLGARNGPSPRKRTTAWRRKQARLQARNGWRAFYSRSGRFKPRKPDTEAAA